MKQGTKVFSAEELRLLTTATWNYMAVGDMKIDEASAHEDGFDPEQYNQLVSCYGAKLEDLVDEDLVFEAIMDVIREHVKPL